MKTDINIIIARELAGQATPQEIDILRDWIDQSDLHKKQYQLIRLSWVQDQESIKTSQARVFSSLTSKLAQNRRPASIPLYEKKSRAAVWRRVAASLLVVAVASVLLYTSTNRTVEEKPPLTQMVTKEAMKGVKRQVTLPDGTQVWLNSGSQLNYPDGFTDTSRVVYLRGEAFFEVAKDTGRPFSVIAGKVETVALGTAFNINAFDEASTTMVALTEGKVEVKLVSDDESVILSPGYAAVLDKSKEELKAMPFQPDIYTAWKDGILVFDHAAEQQVLTRLENWYGVTFKVTNQSPQQWDLTTRFENESLEHVLKVTGFKAGFDYVINNKEVTITYR